MATVRKMCLVMALLLVCLTTGASEKAEFKGGLGLAVVELVKECAYDLFSFLHSTIDAALDLSDEEETFEGSKDPAAKPDPQTQEIFGGTDPHG